MEFQQLVNVFGTRMKALEVLALLYDVKKVVRHGYYEHELCKVLDFCREHHLFVEQSRHTVVIDDAGGFTNRGRVALHDKGMRLVYISTDEMSAAQACLAETKCDHYQTGKMLGYPTCCVRFFCDQFAAGNLNPVHVPTNPWTNLKQREKDACLLSHFPCSSDCEESIRIGKRNFEMLKEADLKSAELFLSLLQ